MSWQLQKIFYLVSIMKIFENVDYIIMALQCMLFEKKWIEFLNYKLYHTTPSWSALSICQEENACHDSSLFPLTLHPNLFPISLCLALLGSFKLIPPRISVQRKSRRCFKNIFLHLNVKQNFYSMLYNQCYIDQCIIGTLCWSTAHIIYMPLHGNVIN